MDHISYHIAPVSIKYLYMNGSGTIWLVIQVFCQHNVLILGQFELLISIQLFDIKQEQPSYAINSWSKRQECHCRELNLQVYCLYLRLTEYNMNHVINLNDSQAEARKVFFFPFTLKQLGIQKQGKILAHIIVILMQFIFLKTF